jgi:hypothetical protein
MNVFRMFKIVAMMAIVSMLAACAGEPVEVPPTHVGKIMGKDGFREGIIPNSKFRLDWCWWYCDSLFIMSVADQTYTETMDLFMPQDRLVMSFDLRLTLTPKPGEYDSLFGRVNPAGNTINVFDIYQTYAAPIIRSEAREILSAYTIAEVASSREAVNDELTSKLTQTIESKTPFTVRFTGIADITYPEVITNAQIAAAQRREEIQQEEAQLEISKVALERELQEERLKRAIAIEKAQAEADVNLILADSVTPAYVTYKQLEALQSIAVSENTKFLPVEMLSTMAGQVMIGNAERK